jgi:outer membrane protein OmpA-like peptidoglycan-associated protein/uncharacterized protein YidB (DUF937 family)
MALFDNLIGEVASQCGLGAQAGPFVRELLQVITGGSGGLAGFIDRLKGSGLGSEVASWVGGTGTAPLPAQTVQSALGSQVVNGIASRLGLGAGVVSTALGYALPKVVGLLTPGGVVPRGLSAEVENFLRPAGRTAARTVEQVRPAAMTVIPDHQTHFFRWGIPIAAALGLAALLWYLAPSSPPAPAIPPAPVAVAPSPPPAVAAVQPWLWLTDDNGNFTYSGQVRDEATKTSVIDALRTHYGADKIKGAITVDPNVSSAQWTANLGAALDNLKVSGLQALFAGNSVNIGGLASDADRDRLIGTLRSALGGGLVFGSLADKVGDLVAGATGNASLALTALKTNFSAADVVSALNLSIINFTTGSAAIPGASTALLREAAAKIRQLPAGTVIEIGGHTDNTGDPAANVALSQQRAEAVRNALIQAGVDPSMLAAKGYGGAAPVSSNDTADGRFRNRRIEYRVVKTA